MGIQVVRGNFLSASRGLLLATGNGVVRKDGLLTMGAGAAKALAQAYPHLPRVFGRMVQAKPRMVGGWHLYGLLTLDVAPGLSVGLFQTKGNWRDRADLGIIRYSATTLAQHLERNPQEVHMAFPGIGLGGLEEGEVLEVLKPFLKGFQVFLYKL
jgi:hypothetical protein